jgi:LexA-binding, inner membrane-associated putative hydrolase
MVVPRLERRRRPKVSVAGGSEPLRAPGQSPWLREQRGLSLAVVLTCVSAIAAADLLISLWKPPLGVQALLDEPAHAATGVLALGTLALALGTLALRVDLPVMLAVLGGSLLIDLDHVPALLGSDLLQHGTPRPYTHSLLTVVVVAAAVCVVPGHARKLSIAGVLALVLHLFRDMAEPGGPGVALLWPLSDRAYVLAYVWYAAALGLLVMFALTRRIAAARAPRQVE